MIRTLDIGYHLQNTNGHIILSNLNIKSQNGSRMDNIKTDEAATFCCGLTGEEQLFLKTQAARGRREWLFKFRLLSLSD
jgi:hypothetical protein